MTARRKHKLAPPRYELDKHLTGPLAGAHIVMGGITGHELIRMRSGEMTESDSIAFTAAKVLEHDLDTADILDLDHSVMLAISQAWRDAMKETAVPPAPGNS